MDENVSICSKINKELRSLKTHTFISLIYSIRRGNSYSNDLKNRTVYHNMHPHQNATFNYVQFSEAVQLDSDIYTV